MVDSNMSAQEVAGHELDPNDPDNRNRSYVPSGQGTLAIGTGKAIILFMMRRHMSLQMLPAPIFRAAVGVDTGE